MNWHDLVKPLRDNFVYSSVRLLVYILKENGLHDLSSERHTDSYAEEEIERYSEEFYLNDRDLEKDFTRDAKSYQPTCHEQSLFSGKSL